MCRTRIAWIKNEGVIPLHWLLDKIAKRVENKNRFISFALAKRLRALLFFALGFIQIRVCGADEIGNGYAAGMLDGAANADVQLIGHQRVGVCLLKGKMDLLTQGTNLRGGGCVADDDKLIPAITAHKGVARRGTPQRFGNADQR